MSDVRTLARVEKVEEIEDIPDADLIVAARIGGWRAVVSKDDFNVGDEVVYFEIDSALPLTDPRFAFLEKHGAKTLDDGRTIHRLKTKKLRGVYSQGLALPASDFRVEIERAALNGTTLAEELGVLKFEPPLPTGINTVGEFPTRALRKTDSERVQNLARHWDKLRTEKWIATEKVDGTSLTVFKDADGTMHVCSRNWEIERPASIHDADLYWGATLGNNLDEMLEPGQGLQAEIVGAGVSKNPMKLPNRKVVIFSFLIGREPQPREVWPKPITPDTLLVPVLDMPLPESLDALIETVSDLKSAVAPGRRAEGVVFHHAEGRAFDELGDRSTFKVISNKYLLKNDG